MSEEERKKIKEYQRKGYQKLIRYKKEAFQKSFVSAQCKMSKKKLKFDNIKVNKKEFHKSKQPVNLDLVNVAQIVVSDKFKNSYGGFKYFIGYTEGEILRFVMYYLTSNEWIHKIL